MDAVTDDVFRIQMPRPTLTPPWRPQTREPVGCHLLDGDERVLFGAGYGFSADQLVDELERFGGLDVVIVEHGHPDHYGAVPTLLEAFDGLTFAMPADDAGILDKVYNGVAPDVLLEDGDQRWGLECVSIPGHTPGNAAFLDAARGQLFAGDSFVAATSDIAAPDDWSGAFAPIDPVYNMDDDAAKDNLQLLEEYAFEAALLTHGDDYLEGARRELGVLLDDLSLG